MTLSQRGEKKTQFFVKKQSVRSKDQAFGPGVVTPVLPPLGATTPFPRAAQPTRDDSGLWQRAKQFCAPTRLGMPVLVPTEMISAILADLPGSSARQRGALLAYAVEDRIAQPIESVVVAAARLHAALSGRMLALIIGRAVLAELLATAPDGATAMPDMLLIRRPDAPAIGAAWAIWRDGARAIVRVSDGTGFAVNVDMLAVVWARAGKPALTSLGAALPTNLPALDLSAAPPDPDPADLAFRFPVATTGATRQASLRPLILSGVIALAGCAALLALAVADNFALARIAEDRQATTQAALDQVLPGVTLGPDIGPVLSRLAPIAPQATQGAFLPLLAGVTSTLTDAGPSVTFRRLTWGEADNQLTLTVQAGSLEDLQAIEQSLTAQGFAVTSGAATAGDGGAEVDLGITKATQ